VVINQRDYNVFKGKDAVAWMKSNLQVASKEQAIDLGNQVNCLIERNIRLIPDEHVI